MNDVAFAIEKSLLESGGIFTYRGEGVFLCIPGKRPQGQRIAMQKALRRNYRDLRPSTGRIVSNLFVGEKASLGKGLNGGLLTSLAMAVDSVERLSLTAVDIFDAPKCALKRKSACD